eukprot:780638-Rhodomonas_salina.1
MAKNGSSTAVLSPAGEVMVGVPALAGCADIAANMSVCGALALLIAAKRSPDPASFEEAIMPAKASGCAAAAVGWVSNAAKKSCCCPAGWAGWAALLVANGSQSISALNTRGKELLGRASH